MLCPRCYGTHVVLVRGQRVPCPDCGGLGEIHCCDGLTEQPDGFGGPGTQEACTVADEADAGAGTE